MLQTIIKDKQTEIHEVLENYNNIEKECVAAKQTVSPEVKERVLKLKEDWTYIKEHSRNAVPHRAPSNSRASSEKSDSEKSTETELGEFLLRVGVT